MIQTLAILFIIFHLVTQWEAHTQTPASDGVSIGIKANVVDSEDTSLDIITLQNMTIRPEDFLESHREIFISPIKSSNAGLMLLRGNPNAGVTIHYQTREYIHSHSGNDYISINYMMSGYDKRNQQASKLIETTDVFINLNEEGKYYLWIGGLIDTKNAGADIYSGDFVFEISYQ